MYSTSMMTESNAFARLGSVVYNARLTLRLFALLPLYVKARKLLWESKNMDHMLLFISALQCSLFVIFQFLENVAFLMDVGVIRKRLSGRWSGNTAGRVSFIYRLAHRAWFLGVMCDFFRLIREAQIFFDRSQVKKDKLTEEDTKKAAQWYYEWIPPLAWLPIGWELSTWSDSERPGFNLGLQGICGVLADLRNTTRLWHATKPEVQPAH